MSIGSGNVTSVARLCMAFPQATGRLDKFISAFLRYRNEKYPCIVSAVEKSRCGGGDELLSGRA